MPDDSQIDKRISVLEQKLKQYEDNGAAKLYYALNRKMNEMADMLNKNSLSEMALEDAKDKSFDRIFKLLEKSETVANSAKTLGVIAGVTGDEKADISRRPFIETVAIKREQV